MKTVIRYPKQFSKEIKEFVIVLTNFGELKSIKNLPIDSFNLFKTFTQESSVSIIGTVVKNDRAPGGYEIFVNSFISKKSLIDLII